MCRAAARDAADPRCGARQLSVKRTILVTSALPYANNSLHLGHVARLRPDRHLGTFPAPARPPLPLRLRERRTRHADDAARGAGRHRAEALIERVSAEHSRDFATYRISVDNYLTTHAPENEELTTELYRRLAAGGFIARKTIKQAYDEARQMFLPDRYVQAARAPSAARRISTATRARTAARRIRRSSSRTPSRRCPARRRRCASPSTCS